MIQLSTANEWVYTLLEKANGLPLHFNADYVFCFDKEDDLYLVMYTFSNRNFICFTALDYLHDNNALIDLMEAIQDYSLNKINVTIVEEALKIIENKMHSKNNGRFYFDAH
jgi:hypothetical protein